MAQAVFRNSIWVNVSTSGLADFTTTTALASYQTFVQAGMPNGAIVHYSARTATEFENGEGTYNSGTGVVTRTTIYASSNAGAKVNFGSSPTLAVSPLAEDFLNNAFGPGSSTANAIARWNGTTGILLKNSGVIIDDSNNVTGVNDITVGGNIGGPSNIVNFSANDIRITSDGAGQIFIRAQGVPANITTAFVTKGTGTLQVMNQNFGVMGGYQDNASLGVNTNFLLFQNAAAGSAPMIRTGAFSIDTNVGMGFQPKGTGQQIFYNADGTTQRVRISDQFTSSTSTSTGTMVVVGGLGAQGDIRGNNVYAMAGGIGFGGGGGSFLQASSITTSVSISFASVGEITTVSSTLAAGSEITFAVTSSIVTAHDMCHCWIKTYTGTGDPIVEIRSVAAGTFSIIISNLGASALSGPLVIGFAIFKGVIA